jgi:hypothetical protein
MEATAVLTHPPRRRRPVRFRGQSGTDRGVAILPADSQPAVNGWR